MCVCSRQRYVVVVVVVLLLVTVRCRLARRVSTLSRARLVECESAVVVRCRRSRRRAEGAVSGAARRLAVLSRRRVRRAARPSSSDSL